MRAGVSPSKLAHEACWSVPLSLKLVILETTSIFAELQKLLKSLKTCFGVKIWTCFSFKFSSKYVHSSILKQELEYRIPLYSAQWFWKNCSETEFKLCLGFRIRNPYLNFSKTVLHTSKSTYTLKDQKKAMYRISLYFFSSFETNTVKLYKNVFQEP